MTDDDLPVEMHRLGINEQNYDHRDPFGRTWRLRRSSGESWCWYITSTILSAPENVEEPT